MDTKHISIQIWSDDNNNFLNCEEQGKVERKQKGKEPKEKEKVYMVYLNPSLYGKKKKSFRWWIFKEYISIFLLLCQCHFQEVHI